MRQVGERREETRLDVPKKTNRVEGEKKDSVGIHRTDRGLPLSVKEFVLGLRLGVKWRRKIGETGR